jgi:uncharacterized protein affecting Mg2+/Co2+ transport
MNNRAVAFAWLLAACGLGGLATAASEAVTDKAAKKISKAIGEEIGDFTVTAQEAVDAPTGYKGTQYTVMTKGGTKFKCEILEPSKLGKIATWGMGSGADAMCTEFSKETRTRSETSGAPASVAPAAVEPIPVTDKAAKKISKAIGEEIGDFTVTAQEAADAPTGYKGTQYTVMTNGGKKFKCEILEPSKLGKIATWGMGSGADAMCTDFTKGSSEKGKTNSASCNQLLRAAGKC